MCGLAEQRVLRGSNSCRIGKVCNRLRILLPRMQFSPLTGLFTSYDGSGAGWSLAFGELGLAFDCFRHHADTHCDPSVVSSYIRNWLGGPIGVLVYCLISMWISLYCRSMIFEVMFSGGNESLSSVKFLTHQRERSSQVTERERGRAGLQEAELTSRERRARGRSEYSGYVGWM